MDSFTGDMYDGNNKNAASIAWIQIQIERYGGEMDYRMECGVN